MKIPDYQYINRSISVDLWQTPRPKRMVNLLLLLQYYPAQVTIQSLTLLCTRWYPESATVIRLRPNPSISNIHFEAAEPIRTVLFIVLKPLPFVANINLAHRKFVSAKLFEHVALLLRNYTVTNKRISLTLIWLQNNFLSLLTNLKINRMIVDFLLVTPIPLLDVIFSSLSFI